MTERTSPSPVPDGTLPVTPDPPPAVSEVSARPGSRWKTLDDEWADLKLPGPLMTLARQGASGRWNQFAAWIVFVGGTGLTALWTVLVLTAPGASSPAPVEVVVASMILGTVSAISGAVMLLIATMRPAPRFKVAVEAVEAKMRLEKLAAEARLDEIEIEERARTARER